MKKNFLWLALISFLAILPGVTQSQDQPPKQPEVKPAIKEAPKQFRPRGRVALAPEVSARLHKAAMARYGNFMKAMPKVTATTWDCRLLGLAPPVIDQGQCGSCFKGDTMIRMADGSYRRIDKICIGESVISAEGNTCKVLKVMQRTVAENLSSIRIAGQCFLEATHEHPVLTQDGYVPIAQVKVGQYVAIPRSLPVDKDFTPIDGKLIRPKTNLSVFFPFGGPTMEEVENIALTPTLGRLLGLYIAEGTAQGADRKLIWTLNISEAETFAQEIVAACASELGVQAEIKLLPEHGSCKVIVNSAQLDRQFLAWFGSGPQHKTIPGCFMSGNREFLTGLLSGWLDGDRQRGESAVTVSPILAMQMRDIANYLGYMPALSIHTEAKTDSRGVTHLRSWRVAMNNPLTYKRGAAKITDTHMWRKVTEVEEGEFYSGTVYNLEVEDDHSYTANGIGVHNCWDFSGCEMVTAAYLKAGYTSLLGATGYFSPQYVLDCVQSGGCNGDDNTTVLIAAKAKGVPLASDYTAYHESTGRCTLTDTSKLHKLDDWLYVDPSNQNGITDTQMIKNAIVQYGPVGCAVLADSSWDNYQPGKVLTGPNPVDRFGNPLTDHDVLILGWDDPKGAWLTQNSWSDTWGDKGTCWIKYANQNIGVESVVGVKVSIAPPPPTVTVTGVAPATGTAGTVVVVSGTGFSNAATVSFGATPATKVSYISATSLTATVPAPCTTCTSNIVDVTVTVNGATSTVIPKDQFTYSAAPIPPGPIPGPIPVATTLGTVTFAKTNTTLDGKTVEMYEEGLLDDLVNAYAAINKVMQRVTPTSQTPEPPLPNTPEGRRIDNLEKALTRMISGIDSMQTTVNTLQKTVDTLAKEVGDQKKKQQK